MWPDLVLFVSKFTLFSRSNGDIANLDDLADVDPHLLNIEVGKSVTRYYSYFSTNSTKSGHIVFFKINHPDETLLSDRLEITELSDEELSPSGGGGGGAIEDGQHLHMRVPTPDYAGQRIGKNNNQTFCPKNY